MNVQSSVVRRQARDLHHRPDFDGSDPRRWNPGGNGNGLVQVPGVDQEKAAKLLARLRKRAVRYERFTLAHPDTGRRGYWMQRGGGQILPARVKILREPGGFSVTLFPLAFAQGLLVKVNQQHVRHACPSIIRSNGNDGIDSPPKNYL